MDARARSVLGAWHPLLAGVEVKQMVKWLILSELYARWDRYEATRYPWWYLPAIGRVDRW